MSNANYLAGTVGEQVQRLRDHVDALYERPGVPWRASDAQAVEAIEARIGELLDWPGDMEMVTIEQILTCDHALDISEREREVLIWQHRNHLALGEFYLKLYDLVDMADETNLALLRLAYPDLIEGLRLWRNDSDFAKRLRTLPLAFSI